MALIAVRVTARSSNPGIGSWRATADGRDELQVRVAEAPTDGAANEALIKLLAKTMNIPRNQIAIGSGHASRHKRVSLPLSEAEFRARLK